MKEVVMHDGFAVQIGPHGNSVRIDPEAALEVIGQAFGLYPTDHYCLFRRIVVAGLPEMPALELQETPMSPTADDDAWDTIEILSTDPKDIEAFEHFQALMKYIKEKESKEK